MSETYFENFRPWLSVGVLSLLFLFCLSTDVTGQTFNSTDPPIGIPDNSCPASGTGGTMSINVSGLPTSTSGTFGVAYVCLDITHPYDGDLEIFLQAPDGTLVELSTDNGAGGANYTGTCFYMTAGTSITAGTAPFSGNYIPEGDLNDFNAGLDPNGTWTLLVCDDAGTDVGILNSWEITFSNIPVNPPASSADCIGAIPICDNVVNEPSLTNGEGAFPNEYDASDPNMCLDSESQSTWYIFTANSTGDFGFELQPVNPIDDFDWALFDFTGRSCEDLFANSPSWLVSCNAAGGTALDPNACSGTTGANVPAGGYTTQGGGCDVCPPNATEGCSPLNALIPVVAGNTYLLYISNWSGSGDGYTLDFTPSSVGIFDDVDPTLDLVLQPISCGATTITFEFSENVLCSTVEPTDFTLIGPDGTNHVISDVSSASCSLSDFGLTYTATFTPPLTINGTYSLNLIDEVTDNCGNIAPTNTLNFDVTNLTDANFSYDSNTYCQTATDPTPTVSLGGGTFTADPAGIVINAADGTIDLDASTPGTYTITHTVTDAGCEGTAMQMVTIVASISPMITGVLEACTGGTTILDAGAGYTDYEWSTTETSQTISVGPGTYSVTVTDASGCTGTDQVIVTPVGSLSPDITGTLEACTGGTTTLDAGAGYTDYEWSTTETSQTIDVVPGTYSVTVTDASGCTGTDQVIVTPLPDLMPNISGSNTFCTGGSSTLDAGAGYTDYEWSTTETSQTITVSASGAYSVTVTDANGCTGSASITVTEATELNPDIIGNTGVCSSSLTTLDAGAGYTDYEWSTTETSQTIDVGPGTYSVTVTDATGCTGTDDVIVTTLPDLMPTITGSNTFCTGGNTTLDAGAGYTDYEWSTTETSQTIMVSTSDTYIVTVTDANGCTGSASIVVTEASELMPSITGTLEACAAGTTTLDAGAGYTTYEWSNMENGQMVDVGPGTYIVTVTDATGCTGTDQVEVMTLPDLMPSITGTLEACAAGTTTLDAGAGYATYEWSNMESGQMVDVGPGTYTVTVTDAAGCTGTDQVEVMTLPDLMPSITGTLEACAAGTTTLDAGTGYATYEWSNMESGQMVDVGPGTYTVTVTDAAGCTGTDQVEVMTLPDLMPDISGTTEVCENKETTLDAGTWASYEWSNMETGQMINVGVGIYTVTVTDAAGCTGTDQVEVTQLPTPTPMILGSGLYCGGGGMTTLDAGAGYTDYEWSTTETTQTIDVGTAGVYTVTVTDGNGCTASTSIPVVEVNLSPDILGDLEVCSGGATTMLDAGTYASYMWSNMETTQTIDVPAGIYSVTVTDDNGCTGTDQVEVTNFPDPMPSITGGTEYCPDGGTTTLDAGTWTSYEWSTTETTQTIDVGVSGTYIVTVTDGNGCTGTTSVEVMEGTAPTPTIAGTLAACSNGTTSLDAGSGYTNYVWSNTETTQTVEVGPGTYTVTVTDDAGCTGSNTVTVNDLGAPTPTIIGEVTFCDGGSTTLNAGTWTSYEWSTTETTQTIEVSASGTYAVTVTDALGCTGATNITVTEEAPLNPAISGTLEACAGGTTTLDAGTWTSYEWSTTETTQTIEAGPGTYTVTVTDADGCTGTDQVEVLTIADLTPSISGTLEACSDGVTTLDAGTWASYEWSTTETTQTIEAGPGIYSVTVTDGAGCTGTDQVEVLTLAGPNPIITGDAEVCDGEVTILDAGDGYSDYTWSTGDSGQFIEVGPGTYSVTVTDANGCTGDDVWVVGAIADPGIFLSADPGVEVTFGTQVTLTANNVPDGSTIVWTADNGDNPTGGTSVTVTPTQSTTYMVEVTTPDGCVYTATFSIVVNTVEFEIPNAFSPDGDDLNESFGIVFDPGQLEVIEMKVFDRWGELVHDNVTNWDGRHNGQEMPQDIYVYFIRFVLPDGTEEFRKGDVALLR